MSGVAKKRGGGGGGVVRRSRRIQQQRWTQERRLLGEATPAAAFQRQPAEVIGQIAGYLRRRSDVAAMLATCRAFHRALSDEKVLKRFDIALDWPDQPHFLCRQGEDVIKFPVALRFSHDRSRLAAVYITPATAAATTAATTAADGDRKKNLLAIFDKKVGFLVQFELLSTANPVGFQIEFSRDGRKLLLLDNDGWNGNDGRKEEQRNAIRIYRLPPVGERYPPQASSHLHHSFWLGIPTSAAFFGSTKVALTVAGNCMVFVLDIPDFSEDGPTDTVSSPCTSYGLYSPADNENDLDNRVRHGRVASHGDRLLAWVQCLHGDGNDDGNIDNGNEAEEGPAVSNSFYLVDLIAGTICRYQLNLQKGGIVDLAFSADGKYLAATFLGENIVMVQVDSILAPGGVEYSSVRLVGKTFGARYGGIYFQPNEDNHLLLGSLFSEDEEEPLFRGYNLFRYYRQTGGFFVSALGPSNTMWKVLVDDDKK